MLRIYVVQNLYNLSDIYRKMSRNEAVRMDVLERVCVALRVDIGDVCSFLHRQ